jgi:hypothetical protein
MRPHFKHLRSKSFQWYNKLFNPMSFDPYNRFLKIWKCTGTPIPKVGAHLGVWRFIPSHFLALPWAWNVTPALPSWPAPSQALALVVSPKLGLQHKITSLKFETHMFMFFCVWFPQLTLQLYNSWTHNHGFKCLCFECLHLSIRCYFTKRLFLTH